MKSSEGLQTGLVLFIEHSKKKKHINTTKNLWKLKKILEIKKYF